MSLLEALISLVGDVPSGYEPFAWVIGACFAFYMITTMFGVLVSIIRR